MIWQLRIAAITVIVICIRLSSDYFMSDLLAYIQYVLSILDSCIIIISIYYHRIFLIPSTLYKGKQPTKRHRISIYNKTSRKRERSEQKYMNVCTSSILFSFIALRISWYCYQFPRNISQTVYWNDIIIITPKTHFATPKKNT